MNEDCREGPGCRGKAWPLLLPPIIRTRNRILKHLCPVIELSLKYPTLISLNDYGCRSFAQKKKIFFALHTLVWKYEFQQLGISQNYLLSNTK